MTGNGATAPLGVPRVVARGVQDCDPLTATRLHTPHTPPLREAYERIYTLLTPSS
ncbi:MULTISPECIES: hypothetical protein [Fischerella]|uniref:hypothetical protein n=1 Tax=Fischerella TaxID=1190 RepID=UPI0003172EA7|nr:MULTISPECIES: hypothetical protein [Fischerella]MBD2430213.1 hypothetical protein [Fischerella sp. FACHB-380]